MGLTLRQDLGAASASDAAASCAAPDVVQDVLHYQAGTHQAHAVAVHQLQEISPSLIDESDARQVNRASPIRVVRLGGVPAVFQLTDPCPGEPTFELQAEWAIGIM
jgi:hypothetical protein